MRKTLISLSLSVIMLFNIFLSGCVFPVVSIAAEYTYDSFDELRETTNLIKNGGFETTHAGTIIPNDCKHNGVLTSTEDTDIVYKGTRSGKITTNGNTFSYPDIPINLEKDKLYLFSSMVLADKDNLDITIVGYEGGYFQKESSVSASSFTENQWKNIYMLLKQTGDTVNFMPTVHCWTSGKTFYVDDYYFGELMVAGIDCSSTVKSVKIPKDNEPNNEITLVGKALNQLGNEDGLGASVAPVTFSLAEAKQGVEVKNGKLIVKPSAASNSKVKIKATCNPEVLEYQKNEENEALKEAYLSGREQIFEITLEPNNYTKPRALDIKISGSPVPGTEIECDYLFAQVEGKEEGATEYQWYVKDNTVQGNEFEPIPGAISKKYIIDSEYTDCSFKVDVTPKTADGDEGETYTSAPLVNPAAPIASSVRIEGAYGEDFAIGDTLTAKYDYIDPNDFDETKENGTVIKWYRVNKNGDIELHTGEAYTIQPEDADCYIYIKVDPQSSEEPNDDTVYFSKKYEVKEEHSIPVETVLENMRKVTNLLDNPSFEEVANGTLKGWTIEKTNNWNVVQSNENYSGNHCAYVQPKLQAESAKLYYQRKALSNNKTYIASAMVRQLTSNSGTVIMYVSGGGTTVDTDTTVLSAPVQGQSAKWKRCTRLLINESGAEWSPQVTVTSWVAGDSFWIDDYYLGELMIGYIDCSEIETTARIPKKGEPAVVIDLVGTAYNQIGTLDGLTNNVAPISWSLKKEKQGVYIKDGKLYITDMAMSDTKVKVLASCEPKFIGADTQTGELLSGRTKTVEIELIAHDDETPRAENVKIEGRVEAGSTLTCKYDYVQVNGEAESGTKIEWYAKKEGESDYSPITGATGEPVTGETYTVGAEYKKSHIIVKVTPKSKTGKQGETTESSYVVYPKAPIINSVNITGKFAVDEILTVKYNFFDDNGDEEDIDKTKNSFKWYRLDGQTETPIGTSETYKITESDIDKKIKVVVTPYSKKEPYTDNKGYPSSWVLAATKPQAENVRISKISGDLLGGSFDYKHACNIPQGNSIYAWYVNGTYRSTGTTFDASGMSGSTITLKVTPVATMKPYNGDVLSVSYTLEGGSGGGSSGGGGGGGGRHFSTEITKPEIPSLPSSSIDVSKYPEWMHEGIKFVLSNNIMTNVAENEFMPDLKINRADFLYCVMTTLKLGQSEYKGIFNDVAASDAISGYLQSAVDKGIISRDEKFYPNRNVSRAEICKILIEGIKAAQSEKDIKAAELTFTDATQIQEWAYNYVSQAVGIKLMNGMSETEFAPLGETTRAQTATIVMRLNKFITDEVKGE